MKSNYKWLMALLVVGFFGVSSLVIAADIPKDKQVLNLKFIDGKKKAPVKFQHAKHVKEYKDAKGAAITCKSCHHRLKAAPKSAKDVKGCTSCHVAEGQAQKVDGGKKAPFIAIKKGDKFKAKSVIFHETCVTCHKAVEKADPKIKAKKISKCKNCHKK